MFLAEGKQEHNISSGYLEKGRALIGNGGEICPPDIKINSEITTTKFASSVD